MSVNILFAAHPDRWEAYKAPLHDAFAAAAIEANIATEFAPEEVDYIIYAPSSDVQDFTPYTRAKAVLNLWAGVENVVGNKTLKIPLARMVDPGMTQGMVQWISAHVLRHHMDLDLDITRSDAKWEPHSSPLAADRRVSILGMGELGRATGQALAGFGFPVTGWSRSAKSVDGLRTLHGADGLRVTLQEADILVLLLPLTDETDNLLDAVRLALLPEGAVIINPGRGPLIDDDALLAALDSGAIRHATLDVFRIEPLPSAHPYWAHPKVTVTPHIASETRETTASEVIAENVRRGEAGEPFLHLVDRDAGY